MQNRTLCAGLIIIGIALSTSSRSEDSGMGPNSLWQTPGSCGEMSVWDVSMAMCMPLPMAGMPMSMAMLHGNIFGTRSWQSGPRGRTDSSSTQMIMGDIGTSVGDRHYLNADLMLTFEKWTVPSSGYPLLFQIGEENAQEVPYLDAQHPHSSPIMGLTFSDTISLGHDKDHIKVFFAPRGEATDGPVAFMHRTTALINPDAPLGHHIGQDVGHISSTVIGASLKLGNQRFEGSTYRGTEPKPTEVDLPMGMPNSFSLRYVREFSAQWMAMASFARINAPEHHQPDTSFSNRYSASVYSHIPFSAEWTFHNSFIYGGVTQINNTDFLSSFCEEFLFRGPRPRIWGRLEVLQRTPDELAVPVLNGPNRGLWIAALSVGYSHKLASWDGLELALGGSITEHFLPQEFNSTYGSNPWSGKITLQLGGMEMWGI